MGGTGVVHSDVEVGRLRFRVAEAGEGPLVVLCHGFPELGYSWRHQLGALADAGFRVVAPDLRGYGDTDAPGPVSAYSMLHLVGDLVGLIAALGERRAHVVGHDWGAALAWNAALMRPDVVATVCGISVPFQPRRVGRPPIEAFREITRRKGLGEFYMVAYQEPGRAEAELDQDVDRTLRLMISQLSGDTPPEDRFQCFLPESGLVLLDRSTPEQLPGWLTEADLDVFIEAFRRTGFRGPLNWYRNLDANWELTAAFQGALIRQPALYITGEMDHVREFALHHERALPESVPGLTRTVEVPAAGHWVHQEAHQATNQALLEFLVPRRDLAAD